MSTSKFSAGNPDDRPKGGGRLKVFTETDAVDAFNIIREKGAVRSIKEYGKASQARAHALKLKAAIASLGVEHEGRAATESSLTTSVLGDGPFHFQVKFK